MGRKTKFYGWTLVAVFWVIYFINGSFPVIGGSVINAYMARDLHMDRSVLGLGFTILSFSMGIPAPLIALSINRSGVRFTLFLGSLMLIIGAGLMAFFVANDWQYVVIFGVIMGLGVGFGSVLPIQAGVTVWFERKRALAMSIVLSAAGIGGFAAAPVLDRVISAANGNWKAGWLFAGSMSVLAALVAVLFVKNRPSDVGQIQDGAPGGSTGRKADPSSEKTAAVYHAKEDWKVPEAIRTRTFWILFIGSVGYIAPFMTCVAHGVIHLTDLGHSSSAAAMAAGLMLLFSILGRLGAGVFGDRIEPRYIWSAALLFLTAGSLVVINASTAVEVYVYAILVGTGFGAAYVSMSTLIGNYFGTNAFASIMGFLFPINTIFGSSTPFLAGLIYDHLGSYRTAFMGVAVLAILGCVLMIFAEPPDLSTVRKKRGDSTIV